MIRRTRVARAILLVLLTSLPTAAAGLSQSGTTGARNQPPVAKTTVEGLIFDLKNPDPFRRRDAIQMLGDKKVLAAVPELIKLWDDPNVEVRRELVRALGNIRDPRAGTTMAKMLGDHDKDVRRSAIKATLDIYLEHDTPGPTGSPRKVGTLINPLSDDRNDVVIEPGTPVRPEVVPALAERLQDEEKGIRQDAAKALGALQGHTAIPKMLESLKVEKEKVVILALLRSFYKIGDSRVGPDLIVWIYEDDKAIHDEAIFTLGVLRVKEAVRDLTKIYESNIEEARRLFKIIPVSGPDDLQIKAFEALARIAAAESKGLFVKALSHSDAPYRQAAAEGLARLPDKDLIAEVTRQRLRENKENARMAQSFALFRMGRREFLEDLIRGIESDRTNAFSYLLEFGKNEIPLLYPYLESSNAKAREKVAEVLGLIADTQALKHLDPLSKDSNSNVTAAAVRAMRRINSRAVRQSKS